ncbi:hypothetical protein AGLY_005448, partial [Aphis glycines]
IMSGQGLFKELVKDLIAQVEKLTASDSETPRTADQISRMSLHCLLREPVKMQIFLRYLMGKIIDFQVESPETIGHLKSKIQHIEGCRKSVLLKAVELAYLWLRCPTDSIMECEISLSSFSIEVCGKYENLITTIREYLFENLATLPTTILNDLFICMISGVWVIIRPYKKKRNMDLVERKEGEEFGEHKIPMVKSVVHKKLFCPPSMTRIDHNRPHFEYKTVWECLICPKVLLSKTAAINHANICKLPITKAEEISVEELHNIEKKKSFPCKYCSKVMTSKKTWIKHLNKHETPDYDINN